MTTSFEDKVFEIVSTNALRSLDVSGFGRHVDRCESPIEQIMAMALWFRGDWGNSAFDDIASFADAIEVSKASKKPVLATQINIDNFRVDLLALWHHGEGDPLSAFAVECDGHDFHEKTKEQAARDKSRDRALTAAGVKVMRFTGSEIWRNPDGCAGEVLSCMHMDWSCALDRKAQRDRAAVDNVHRLPEKMTGEANSGG